MKYGDIRKLTDQLISCLYRGSTFTTSSLAQSVCRETHSPFESTRSNIANHLRRQLASPGCSFRLKAQGKSGTKGGNIYQKL